MKKKIACIGIVLVMGAALAACGGASENSGTSGEDYAALETVQEKIDSVKDAEIELKIESSIKSGNASDPTTIEIDAVAREVVRPGGGMDMEIHQNQNTDGKKESFVIYVKGGKTYINTGKEKASFNDDQMYGNLGTIAQNLVLGLDKNAVQGVTKKEEKERNVYQITIDNEKFMEYAAAAEGADKKGAELIPASVEKLDFQIITDKANVPKTVRMDCLYSIPGEEQDGKPIESSYKMQAQYRSVNTGISIGFPDFSEYKESGEV